MSRATRITGGRSRRKASNKNTKATRTKPIIEEIVEESEHESEKENSPNSSAQSSEPSYYPEQIVKHRSKDGQKEYFVKWHDWPHSDNTWEPIQNLANCEKLVQKYEQSLKVRAKKTQNNHSKKSMDKSKNESKENGESSSKSATIPNKSESPIVLTPIVPPKTKESESSDGESDTDSPLILTKRQKRNKSMLETSHSNTLDSDTKNDGESESESEESYVVECVVKHRKSVKKKYAKHRENGERCYEYKVKWKDWASDTNTWEHESELQGCTALIDAYWQEWNVKFEAKKAKKSKRKKAKKSVKKVEKSEIESVSASDEKENVKKVKRVRRKKPKARRTGIFDNSGAAMSGNEKESAQNRKRKLETSESAEPPMKKRRIETARETVRKGGFVKMLERLLEDGSNVYKEQIMGLTDEYNQNESAYI